MEDDKAVLENENTVKERESLQYNAQDLSQEQRVNTNPVQLNTQNITIVVSDEKEDFSGKITGITYVGKPSKIQKDVAILLFFGQEGTIPVYRTKSDENGNYVIEDLPSGFYTIVARYNERQVRSQFIKLLPGENVYESLIL